jgi:hypothetical protein
VPRRPVVTMPIIHPPGGDILEPTTIKLSCSTHGARISYTLDGSHPDSHATVYDDHTPLVLGGGSAAEKKKVWCMCVYISVDVYIIVCVYIYMC